MKGRIRRAAAAALSAVLCMAALFLAAPAEASAYTGLDTSKPCSLELSYHPDHGDWDGIAFRMYKVGTITDSANLAFTDDWKDVPVSMKNLNATGWAKLANTLAGYVEHDSDIRCDYVAYTNSKGDAKFENVDSGVYVLIGDSHSVEVENKDGSVTTYHYEPRPEMVILPYLGGDGWVQGRRISAVKYEVTDSTTNPYISRRVMKVWDDSGHKSERPTAVQVALLQDGSIRDVVTLSSVNNWRHDWHDLPSDSTYRVVELGSFKNYYTYTYRDSTTFVVTNVYEEPDDPYVPPYTPPKPPVTPDVPEPPVKPDPPTIIVTTPPTEDVPEDPTPLTPWIVVVDKDPTPEDIKDPDTPLSDPPTEDLPDPDVPLEDLPQTGQLWWPVPVLAGLAVACLGVGVALLRKKDPED